MLRIIAVAAESELLSDNVPLLTRRSARRLIPPDNASPKAPPKSIQIVPSSCDTVPPHRNNDKEEDTIKSEDRRRRQSDAASVLSSSSSTSDDDDDDDASAKSKTDTDSMMNVSDYDELSDEGSDDHDNNNDTTTLLSSVQDLRFRMSTHSHRDGRPRYAIKRLKSNLSDKVKMDAAIDLACEAKFLGNIAHSNIVRLRATVGTPGTVTYALILDCLTQTLDVKMLRWRQKYKKYRGILGGMFGRDQVRIENMITERLLVAFDIARAYVDSHICEQYS